MTPDRTTPPDHRPTSQAKPATGARQFVLGDAFRATILTSAAETDGRHDVVDGIQPPGATTPLHLHTRYDERFWVVSGSMTIWAGPETVTLQAGDFYAVPADTPHMIRAGPDGARALSISSPAAFAELVARTGTPADVAHPDTPFDIEAFTAVSTELGDVILGPPGTTPAELALERRRAAHEASADSADRRGLPSVDAGIASTTWSRRGAQ